MGRRERELDPAAGPVPRFAVELRKLREAAGRPSYRELAKRAHYAVTTLAEAAGGDTAPSLAVTLAYVSACGGDRELWTARWHALMAEISSADAVADTDGAGCPYLGLAPFEPRHAELFFGRTEEVAELRARIGSDTFLAVFGASGSGKSSLLRAGLLPALRNDVTDTFLLTPGRHPVEELAVRVANLLGVAAAPLAADLLAHPEHVGLSWRQAFAAEDGTRVVLMVDQFEEVFTLCGDERERRAFVRCLAESATGQNGRVRVVLGIRADFLARCAQYPELVVLLRDRQVLVGPMDDDALRSVVREPGALAGMKVETALVEAVVADARGEPGALPLVSHALYETWRLRGGSTMSLAAYRAAGGVHGAIAQTAERVYHSFDEHEQTVVRDVFLRLTALGQGTEDTRRRVTRTELARADADDVLSRLAAARLITLGEHTVEVAHEALIRSWPRLRTWLTEDREHLTAHRRLTDTATEWRERGRDDGLLHRGARLAEWEGRDTGGLNDLEREFLTASRNRALAERAAARRRVRLGVGGLAAAVVALTVLATVALVQARRAEAGRELAYSRQLVASARGQFQLDPELGLLLARRAYAVGATDETEAALRQATFESRVRATVSSHGGQILGVSLSPDGRRVATSGSDGAIRVWRFADTLRDPIVLRGHKDYVWTPSFSPDGTRVVAASLDGTVSVWDWAHGTRLALLRGHEAGAWSATFSPDGRQVASASDDGTVRVWDPRGRGRPVVLRGHDGRTLGVAYRPDGRVLASSGGDGTVRLWDVRTWRTTAVLRGHENSVEAVAFSPDGRRIATASTDGTVRLWDLANPDDAVVLGTHDGTAEGVSFNRDGTRVASAGNDGTVRIWRVDHRTSGSMVLRGHRGTAIATAFTADDRRLISVSEDGTAKIWDVRATGRETVLSGHNAPVWAAVTSADGRVAASASADGTARVWRPGTTAPPVVLRGHDGEVLGTGISRDGRLVASTGEDGTVRLWSAADRRELAVLRGHRGEVWTAAFSADGRRVATGGSDGTVRVWPTSGGGAPVVFDTGQERVRYVAMSADGRRVASAGKDGTVRVLELDGGDEVVLRGHRGLVWSVTFSPDGRYVLSGGNDGTARLWDLRRGEAARVLAGHQGVVWSVAFSPDGRTFATSGNDATTRIWRTGSTSPPIVMHGFGASVESAVFVTPTRFVSAHDDGTVRLWTCAPCAPIGEVLDSVRVTRDLTDDERARYLNEPTPP